MEKNNKRFTKKAFYKKGRSKLVISAIILAFIMIVAPLYAFADGNTPTAKPALGLSTVQIGASTGYSVYTAADLQAAIDLDDNGDYSKIVLFIEEDFSIGDVSEWIPLGSSEVPFNGTIEGKDHLIAGVGHSDVPLGQSGDDKNSKDTLLGHLNGATIKDLSVETAKLDTESNPYYGLLISAENSTIINCHVYPLNPLSTMSVNALMRSGIKSDMAWLAAEYVNPTIVVDDAQKLWTIAEGVSRHNYTFLDKEIIIQGTIDCQNEPFKGIGDELHPFKGSIKGTNAVITNLVLEGVNPLGTGLVAYADGIDNTTNINLNPTGFTIIDGIRIEKVSGVGNSGVGALLGFGKDVVVKNCSVSGEISGTNDVGTLIGRLELTTPFANSDGTGGAFPTGDFAVPYVLDCYSTADVTGATNIGGLVGAIMVNEDSMYWGGYPERDDSGISDVIIKNCFTTGNIIGSSQVGGIVGHTGGYVSGGGGAGVIEYSLAVSDSASMSSINAAVNAGGIVGMADSKKTGPNTGYPVVISSYFAGTIKGSNFLGGLVGMGGDAKDSYVSGSVVTPLAFSEIAKSTVWPISGNLKELEYPSVYTIPNAVFRPGDPFNAEITASQFTGLAGAYPGLTGDANKPIYATIPYNYFNPGVTVIAGFSGGSLTTVSTTTGTTGTFPKLTGLTGSPLHATFSSISTDARITNFPSQFYVNGSKEATNVQNGAAFKLPTDLGITWKVNVTSVDDNTLESGKNNLTVLSDGTIKLDATVSQAFGAIISGETSNGISMKFAVTFVDEAVRPIYDEVPEAYIIDSTKASPGIIFDANIMSLTFPEGVSPAGVIPAGGVPISVDVYADKNFGTVPTTVVGTAKIVDLSDRVLKITFDKNILASDQSYSFKLDSGAIQFKDLAGNVLDTKYFFRTVSNSTPVVTLDSTHDLYAKNEYGVNSISANKDVQVIGMLENDEAYNGYMEGVEVDNPNGQLIDIEDPASGRIVNISVVNNHTMSGDKGYDTLTATKDNFYKIPGEYAITYQVLDPEDPTGVLKSNVATRTYHVYSRAYFTRGGLAYTTLTATFTANDMLNVYADLQAGLSADKAIEKALIARYLADASSADYLAAYQYDYTCAVQNLPVTFDTSPVTSNVFQDGFQSTLDIKAGNSDQSFILEIQSTVPDFEIEVDGNTFVAINSLSRSEVRRFFNARVRQKSTGKIVDYPVIYNFKNVHTNKYNVSQKVTLTMIDPSGITEINGIDMTVSKTVNVVMKRENKFQHPEDVEDIVGAFWAKASSDVKEASKEKELKYNLTYDEATRTPADFFLLVSNRAGKDIEMTLPTGIVLSFQADLINKVYAFENGTELNMSIEPMYDVYVNRDAKGSQVQQFFTADEFNLPGGIGVSIPLDDGMSTDNLSLYYIDEETNMYALVDYIAESQINDGKLSLEMTQYQGRYVITEAELDGNYVGYVK